MQSRFKDPKTQKRFEILTKIRGLFDQTTRSKAKETGLDDIFGDSQSVRSFKGIGMRNSGDPKTVIKRTQQAAKRIATLTPERKPDIIRDLETYNFTNFLPEVEDAIKSIDLNMESEIDVFEVVATLMHMYDGIIDEVVEFIEDKVYNTQDIRQRLPYFRLWIDFVLTRAVKDPVNLLKFWRNLIVTDIAKGDVENAKLIMEVILYGGADFFGHAKPDNSPYPAYLKLDAPIAPKLAKYIIEYYNHINQLNDATVNSYNENIAKHYEIIIKYGNTNSVSFTNAKNLLETHNKLRIIGKYLAYICGKPVPASPAPDGEMMEIKTPNGMVSVPKAMVEKLAPKGLQSPPDGSDDHGDYKVDPFYNTLVDIESECEVFCPIDQISTEVETASDVKRVDDLSIFYISNDSEDNRAILIPTISRISRKRQYNAPYLARFVANVSQAVPQIAEAVVTSLSNSFYGFIQHSDDNVLPPLHIARYLAELTKFKIGIDEYMRCIISGLDKFYGRNIDMVCTLVDISGGFLYNLSDTTRISMGNIHKRLCQFRETHKRLSQYNSMIINIAISAIIPEDYVITRAEPDIYAEFFIHELHKAVESETSGSVVKVRKIAEKLISEKRLTVMFIISHCLEFDCFSYSSLSNLCLFVANFGQVNSEFLETYLDVFFERFRRGLEINNHSFRQRQIAEARFLALLGVNRVIDIDMVLDFSKLILSLNNQDPMKIAKSSRTPVFADIDFDFFRVQMICEFMKEAKPIFDFPTNHALEEFTQYIQIFCLVRSPITYEVGVAVNEVLDCYPRARRYESIKEFLSVVRINFTEDDPYRLQKRSTLVIKKPVQQQQPQQSTEAEEDEPDVTEKEEEEECIKEFSNEYQAFMSSILEETQANAAPAKTAKIPIPPEIADQKVTVEDTQRTKFIFKAPAGFFQRTDKGVSIKKFE